MEIKTNHKPRALIRGWELSESERAQFDYLTDENLWQYSFFYYKGQLFDTGEFFLISQRADSPIKPDENSPLIGWHGAYSDSYFSGLVIKYCDDGDCIIVGRYTC